MWQTSEAERWHICVLLFISEPRLCAIQKFIVNKHNNSYFHSYTLDEPAVAEIKTATTGILWVSIFLFFFFFITTSLLHDDKHQINENTFRLEPDFPLCSRRCDHVLLTKRHIFPVYHYILEGLFSSLNLESGSLFWLLTSKWKPRRSWVNSSVGSSSWKYCVVRSLAVL